MGNVLKRVAICRKSSVVKERRLSIDSVGTLPDSNLTAYNTTDLSSNWRDDAYFLRTSDLDVERAEITSHVEAHFHEPSCDPPHGLKRDENESFVAIAYLNKRNDEITMTPVASLAITSLKELSLNWIYNESNWNAEAATAKLLKRASHWNDWTFDRDGGMFQVPKGGDDSVLVWFGKGPSCDMPDCNFYGSDALATRACGVIDGMSPKDALDRLLDSSRVQEYNPNTVERLDLLEFIQGGDNNNNDDGDNKEVITRVVRSHNKPPILNKSIYVTSVLHAEPFGKDGYLCLLRGVTSPPSSFPNPDFIKAEVISGITLIQPTSHCINACVMTMAVQLEVPVRVPNYLARKFAINKAIQAMKLQRINQ